MPPKKDAKAKNPGEDPDELRKQFKKFLRVYDSSCQQHQATSCSSLIQKINKQIKSEDGPKRPNIPIIHDEDCNVNGIKALIDTLNNYTDCDQLSFWRASFGDEGGVLLANWLRLNSSIKLLEMIDSKITLHTCKAFSNALQSNETLNTVVLDYNDLGDEGAQYLSIGLSWNPSIANLSLRYCNITENGGIVIGNEMIGKNQSLVTLDLQGNALGPNGITQIGQNLPKHPKLESLNLADTAFGSSKEAILELSNGIQQTEILSSLNLNLNKLDEEAAKKLLEVVQNKPTLKSLLLFEEMSPALFKEFVEAIKKNKGAKKKGGKKGGGKKKK